MTNTSEAQSMWMLFKTNRRLQALGAIFGLIFAATLALFNRITDSPFMSLLIAFGFFIGWAGLFLYIASRWIVPEIQSRPWLQRVVLLVGSYFFGIGLSIWLVQKQNIAVAIINLLTHFIPFLQNKAVTDYQHFFPLIEILAISSVVAMGLFAFVLIVIKIRKQSQGTSLTNRFTLIGYAFMLICVTGYIFCTDSMQIGPGQQSIIFYGGTESYVTDRIASPLSFTEDMETYGGFLYGRGSDGVFTIYQSQTGFYASILKLAQTVTKINADDFIKGSRVLLSLVLATMLTLLSLSVKKKFGFLASVIFSVFPLTIFWFIGPAGYLLWFYFILFIPFFISAYVYPQVIQRKISPKKFLVYIFFAEMLVFLRGYEYFPGLIASAAIPVLYYEMQAGKRFSEVVRNLIFVCLAGAAALIGVLIIHFIQLALYYKDLSEPLNFLLNRAVARSASGDTNLLTPLQIFTNWLYVRVFYVSGRFFAIFPQWKANFDLYNNFANLHIFAFVEAGIAILLRVFINTKLFQADQVKKEIRLLFNMAVTMLVAMVASWSWFPALGHMSHHYHMNGIMYMIPFGITLFIFTGVLLQTLMRWSILGLRSH